MAGERGLHQPTLEDKAAEVCWVTVHGHTAHTPHLANREAFGVDTPAEVIGRHRPGGVVLFAWADNTGHPLQVAELVAGLQAAAADVDCCLGVAIDEEGGRVARLGPPATAFPSARAVAAAGDRQLALRRWQATGRELAALGVTANLAPVVDLGHPSNPVLGDRTFADDAGTVAEQAGLAVRGLEDAGVAAVAKHFPGHGAAAVDSHADLPVVELSHGQLQAHLEAFRRLLATHSPAGIMTAHLLVRALDLERPATVSPAVLTELLRDDLGYDGAVVTDSLSMAGIRRWGDDADVAVAALAAGADVLLTPPDLSAAVAGICRAVREGRLAEQRLDEARARGAALRRPVGGDASTRASTAPNAPAAVPSRVSLVGHPDHQLLAVDLARRAVSITDDRSGRLPLAAGETVVVAGLAGSGARPLVDALRSLGTPAWLFELTVGERDELPLAVAPERTLVLVRRVPELDASVQDRFIGSLAGSQDNVVLVETGASPAAWSPERTLTVLVAHGCSAASMNAAAEALTATLRRTEPLAGLPPVDAKR